MLTLNRTLLPFAIALPLIACGGEDAPAPDTADTDPIEDLQPLDTQPDAELDTTPDTPSEDVPDDTPSEDLTPPDTSAEDVPLDLTPPPETCAEHSECQRCAYPTAPTTLADCYCAPCADAALPVAVCDFNQAAWERVCGEGRFEGPCPGAPCVLPTPVACLNDSCTDACSTVQCPALDCPASEQDTLPGECCPRCTGANTCASDDECTLCMHRNAPGEPSECSCPLCPTHPMTAAQCQDNGAAFDTHCDAEFQSMCPIAMCLPAPPPVCSRAGTCEADPHRCDEPDDCELCPWPRAPVNAADCACRDCGTAMPRSRCDAIRAEVDAICDGFAFDACLPTPCAAPPELVCNPFSRTCSTSDDGL